MLAKRIIPCLDIKDGRTVKGVQFEQLRDAGDAVELGNLYSAAGADELVFLDITATNEGRGTLRELVTRIARGINIPFTVGGGVRTVSDVSTLLGAGADKCAINSAAIDRPEVIDEVARHFGSQCLVVAIDARQSADGSWRVYRNGGRTATDWDLFEWAQEVTQRGAGEILFTSMNHDGSKQGFANETVARMAKSVSIPVIASGGAGQMEDFYDVFTVGAADAALAASIFHFKEIALADLKQYLQRQGVCVRI